MIDLRLYPFHRSIWLKLKPGSQVVLEETIGAFYRGTILEVTKDKIVLNYRGRKRTWSFEKLKAILWPPEETGEQFMFAREA